MAESFKVNRIKRTENNDVKQSNTQERKENYTSIEGGVFVSSTGVHKSKMVIQQNGSDVSKYDFLKGKDKVDISRFAIGKGSDKPVLFKDNRQVFEDDEEPIEKVEDIRINKSFFEEEPVVQNVESVPDLFKEEPVIEEKDDSFFDELDIFKNKVVVEEEVEPKDLNYKTQSLEGFDSNYQTFDNEVSNEPDNDFDWSESKEEPKKVKTTFKGPYQLPSVDDLPSITIDSTSDEEWLSLKAQAINKVFNDFNIQARVAGKIVGPTVTQFCVELMPGTPVSKLNNIAANIELELALEQSQNIRILERIPGTKYCGVEVPNRKRKIVTLAELINSNDFKQFKGYLPVAVGKRINGENVYVDIQEMPHCLICGTTKSGKSVCLNTIILSLLYRLSPNELKFVMVDPKQVELSIYDGIPHLVCPVITEFEYLKPTLEWVNKEMERRYSIIKDYGRRDLTALNKYLKENGKETIPYIVFIMDEFVNWILDAGKEVEELLQKLATKARAAGIHLILAAQRPSADVVKGSIKSQFDTRFAFKVTAREDSSIVLGSLGAEKLVGKGDLLLKYSGSDPERLQACYIDNDNGEIDNIINKLKENYGSDYEFDLDDLAKQVQVAENQDSIEAFDENFAEVARYVVGRQVGSINNVQNTFNVSFNRAKRIFEDMTRLSILGPALQGRPQEVLITNEQLEEILEREGLA